MPARLSSLLVRDGLVGVKRMEKAFQRQVIYGGSLDTILLEMNLVPEERLTQYLALASGLPPAARDESARLDGSTLSLISSEIAAQFRAVPLSLDGEALRVLVCSPLEISELEDLADLLDRPLQPLITPEYRWHLIYAQAYRVDAPARFTTLARHQENDVEEAPPAPVGRAQSIIVDAAVAAPDPYATLPFVAAKPMLPAKRAPQAASSDADLDDKTDPLRGFVVPPGLERGRADTLVDVRGRLPSVPPPLADVRGRPSLPSVPPPLPVPPPSPLSGSPRQFARPGTDSGAGPQPRAPAIRTTPPPGAVTQPYRGGIAGTPPLATGLPRSIGSRGITPRMIAEPIATAGRDSPLAVVRARELLSTADDRDTVFLTLLRAARARARYAGLLTVQGGAAIGRVALAEPGIDTSAVQNVLVPLDVVSAFRTVTQTQQPHIGALTSGDPSVDAMALRLGGTLPPSALLLPIVLRDRVVAIVVAHRVHSDLRLVDVTELLPLAGAAADALGRLIVKHKAAGYRSPASETPKIEIEAGRIETKKIVKKDAAWRTPERPSAPEIADEPELEITTDPPRAINEVLDEIEAGTEGSVDEAITEAVDRASETIAAVLPRFPGKLRVDRFAVSGRPLRASQYGGLLELVVRLGAGAAELVVDKLGSPQRDIRFYAAICALEIRPRSAVFALVERVFDNDFGVRSLAVEALAGYPMSELTHALARARRAVHSSDPDTVVAATSALVQLGDVDCVDDLIGAVERGDRAAEHARKALVAITAQDFGLSEKKWRKWYETARKRHRIEWLIEGLGHKEDAIREGAINDLRRMTGEYFGYHHDLPRRDREVAAERWSSWWKETGMRRFVHRVDERNHPTAVLPPRRD